MSRHAICASTFILVTKMKRAQEQNNYNNINHSLKITAKQKCYRESTIMRKWIIITDPIILISKVMGNKTVFSCFSSVIIWCNQISAAPVSMMITESCKSVTDDLPFNWPDAVTIKVVDHSCKQMSLTTMGGSIRCITQDSFSKYFNYLFSSIHLHLLSQSVTSKLDLRPWNVSPYCKYYTLSFVSGTLKLIQVHQMYPLS